MASRRSARDYSAPTAVTVTTEQLSPADAKTLMANFIAERSQPWGYIPPPPPSTTTATKAASTRRSRAFSSSSLLETTPRPRRTSPTSTRRGRSPPTPAAAAAAAAATPVDLLSPAAAGKIDTDDYHGITAASSSSSSRRRHATAAASASTSTSPPLSPPPLPHLSLCSSSSSSSANGALASLRTSVSAPRSAATAPVATFDGPSLYKLSRGRSTNVSPSRRWDRRGASATVLSGASASGSDSQATPGPATYTANKKRSTASKSRTLATADDDDDEREREGDHDTLGQRTLYNQQAQVMRDSWRNTPSTSTSSSTPSSLSGTPPTTTTWTLAPTTRRRGNSYKDQRGSSRLSRVSIQVEAADAHNDDSGGMTSSDEEGADASRFARSRRASLERERQRGMRILMATSHALRDKAAAAATPLPPLRDHPDQLLTPDDLVVASAVTSATTTTVGDDASEQSSLLSRTPSSDAVDGAAAVAALASSMPRGRASRQKETAFFGLADDEEEPATAALSARALSAALTRRRSRTKSATRHGGDHRRSATASTSPSHRIRSMPASRRPSHHESTCPTIISASVPHRPSAILGFAPVASTSRAAHRHGSVSSRSRVTAAAPWLSPSQGRSREDLVDVLSGSSIGSVDNFVKVDEVNWVNEDNDGAHHESTRSSMLSVLPGQVDAVGGGGAATVAALEATDLLAASATGSVQTSHGAPIETGAQVPRRCSSEELPRRDGDGFAATYEQRLSSLQNQLRLWSRDGGSAATAELPSSNATADVANGPSGPAAPGLLATGWNKIARLPNLFFPGGRPRGGRGSNDGVEDANDADVSAIATSSSEGISSQTASPMSSPEASTIALPRRPSHSRSPSTSSRGVVDPVDGDRDPGAYVSGLGQHIDPDLELSSVVHLQQFRSRGRSVDVHRRNDKAASRYSERVVASDSERRPLINSKVNRPISKTSYIPSPPPLLLPLPAVDDVPAPGAVQHAQEQPKVEPESTRVSLPEPEPMPARATAASAPISPRQRRARFTIEEGDNDDDGSMHSEGRSDEDGGRSGDDGPTGDDGRSSAASRRTSGRGGRRQKVDEEGFIKVDRHRSRCRPRASRPAAAAPVPTGFSAFGSSSGGSSDSDECRGRDGRVTRPGTDEDEDASHSDEAQARGRRGGGGRSRGRDRSPEGISTRSRQCAIGLFSSATGSRREPSTQRAAVVAENRAALHAGVRTVRSSPNLSYARVAASMPVGSSGNMPTRAPLLRQTSDEGQRGRGGGGRGREGGVKVTSCSFSSSEHPRNSLPRLASSSSAMPIGLSKAAQAAIRSAVGSGSATGPSMPRALPSGASSGARTADGQSAGTPHNALIGTPSARPTLLSNSAHLLMLSLEMEMMRAQKISAPLKVRWARQRTATAPAAMVTASAAPEQAAVVTDLCEVVEEPASVAEASPQDGEVSAPSSSSQGADAEVPSHPHLQSLNHHRYYHHRPRQSSRLRNVTNA